MKILEKGHIVENILEDYSLGNLAEPALEKVEEHLLICPHCQDRLSEVDDFVKAFRLAHSRLAASEGGRGGKPVFSVVDLGADGSDEAQDKSGWALPPAAVAWFQRPFAIWASVAVALALLIAIPSWWAASQPSAPAQTETVTLVAQRGEGVEVKAGKIVLNMDLRGINDVPLVVKIVRWDGRQVWTKQLGLVAQIATIAPQMNFTPGKYFIRVHAAGKSAGLLREFGIQVTKS